MNSSSCKYNKGISKMVSKCGFLLIWLPVHHHFILLTLRAGAFLFLMSLVGQILKCRFCVLKAIFSQINKHSHQACFHWGFYLKSRRWHWPSRTLSPPSKRALPLVSLLLSSCFWKALRTPAYFSTALGSPGNSVWVLKSFWLQTRCPGAARCSSRVRTVLSPPFPPPLSGMPGAWRGWRGGCSCS